jgi:FAD/FMN-containing dehydrogenase
VPTPPPALLDRFAAVVGAANALRDPDAIAPYLVEPRGRYRGAASLVLRPGSVAEVSAILRLADETGVGVVPRGGGTGLVGGQIPSERGDEVVVTLSRLNRIRALDPDGDTMTTEAGVILADARAAADAVDRRLPLSLASEGSCHIGGNLATNAGGTGVLAFGSARDLTLGVEVVLASGQIWNGLRSLRKDNTGFDLTDLFVGSEGTLGIITAAVLKLVPRPKGVSVAIVGVPSPDAAVGVLRLARSEAGAGLTACEIIAGICMEAVARHLPGARLPLGSRPPWYVLIEVSSGRSQADAEAIVDTIFTVAADARFATDGSRALSLDQAQAFWHLRESLSEVQKHEGASIKHDVAVPVAAIPAFLERATAAVLKTVPGARAFPFGHLGDGNIHFNVSQPTGVDPAAFLAQSDRVNDAVYDVVLALGGTISAEHGIGRAKRELLARVKSPVELDLMRRLKRTLDPKGILNPGKVL